MSTTIRTRARAVALAAAALTAGGLIPVTTALSASAAPACVAPSGLVSDDALRGPATQIKDVRLAWQPVSGASGYQLQISPSEDFSNNVYVDVPTVSTRYVVAPTVLKPSTYFWRVRATGASCWSDEGAAQAPQFAVAWKELPTPLAPLSGGAPLRPDQLRLAWTAVPEASVYELEVLNAKTGALVGRCYTPHTSYAPYDQVAATGERLIGKNECFGATALGYRRDYVWRVRALDQTKATVDGKPYPYLRQGASNERPRTGQSGLIKIQHVYVPDAANPAGNPALPAEGARDGGQTAVLRGSGFGAAGYDLTHVTFGGVQVKPGDFTVISDSEMKVIVPPSAKHGVVDVKVIVDNVGESTQSARAQWLYLDDVSEVSDIETFTDVVLGPWSGFNTFRLAEIGDPTSAVAPDGLIAQVPDAGGSNLVPCGPECPSTPTLSWRPALAADGTPLATSYRVYVWEDQDQSSLVHSYETASSSLTPREELLDNQAGQSYWWQVQACTDVRCDLGALSRLASFRKRATAVRPASPAPGAQVLYDNIVLTWADWQATNGSALAAAQYQVQVSATCSFATAIDDALVDAPEYVNTSKVFVDGTYFWRVRAIDQSGNPLTWSTPNRDTTTCSDSRSFTLRKTVAGAAPPSGGATAPAVRTVDARDRSVRRSGVWTARKATGSSHGTALVTNGQRKQALALNFTGRSVTVGFCTGPMDGKLAVYVDGKLRRTLNTYGKFTRCRSTYLVTGLSPGRAHTVQVKALAAKGAPRGGMQVVVDWFRIA